ncbi:MAG: hypothetical protein MI741_20215, partial [Rhodospirillales bacterium]|nr:hypothetical protein [Rhodospirillales bacterium]
MSLDAPGDYIQFEYEMNGPDASTFFSQEDYWIGVGLFNDQGDPVTNDQGTELDGPIGFFTAIGWEFGSKSSVYEQRAGDAQILSRSVRDNG